MEDMSQPTKRQIGGPDQKEIGGLLYVGYEDYLSARSLFIQGRLIQGSFLANTSIEKLLKAVLFYSGNLDYRSTHETHTVLDELNKIGFSPRINRQYLVALSLIYNCRYIGDNRKIKPGFNFTILKNKFLAELDFTIDLLATAIKATSSQVGNARTVNELCNLDKTSDSVRSANYIYNGNNKNVYCEDIDDVLELRVLSNYKTLMFKYKTGSSRNDGKFIFTTLKGIDAKPGIKQTTAKPSHLPIPDTIEIDLL